ncbi:hypothetical protein [Streptomyces sp. NPDC090026]|uniref:hypothetical protein n=1 Tax=Streptomyces sp. NPDC090026 TaxID=3365923 RepID=UPI00381AB28C
MTESTDTHATAEALRRVRADGPSPATSAMLHTIAERLSTVRPTGEIAEPRRLALALRVATDVHGLGTPPALRAERDLLAHMPTVRPSETRGEYALRLRKVAGR